MDKLYEELFRAMNQFRKLKFAEMFPMINRTDFFVMCASIRDFQNFKRVRRARICGAEYQ